MGRSTRTAAVGIAALLLAASSAIAATPDSATLGAAGDGSPAHDLVWTIVEDPLLLTLHEREQKTGQSLLWLAGGPEAFVAALDCRRRCPDLLRSADGLAWERVSIDGPGETMLELAYAQGEFLALVRKGPDWYEGPADRVYFLYRSTDGREWRRQAIGKVGRTHLVNGVTAGPGGIVAVGCQTDREGLCQQGTIWTSRDGRTWKRKQPRAAARMSLYSVAASGDRVVISGDDRSGLGGPTSAVVLGTPDGGWTRVDAGLPDGGSIRQLATGADGGFVASVGCCGSGDEAWEIQPARLITSEDGRRWRDAGPTADDPSYGLSLATDGPLMVTTRFEQTGVGVHLATLWWTVDGGWRRQPLVICNEVCGEEADFRAYRAAIGPDGRVAVVGGGVGWLGELVSEVPATGSRLAGPVRLVESTSAGPSTVDGRAAYLLAGSARPDDCVRLRDEVVSREAPSAAAGIECQVRDGNVRMSRHYKFPNADALTGWWESRRVVAALGDDGSLDACADGEPGSGPWPSSAAIPAGEVACSTDAEGAAFLHWTTDDALVGSEAWARQGDLGALARWFAAGRETLPLDVMNDVATESVFRSEGRARAGRQAREDELLAEVGPADCQRWRQEDRPFEFGALAAVQCDRPARGVRQIALYSFPDADTLSDFWTWRVGSIESALRERDEACTDGRPGLVIWEHGEMACYVDRGMAKLRWTDERSGTYGVADANDRDLGRLFEFVVTTVGEELRIQGPDEWPATAVA